MARKVKWTKPALEDLEQTADYIALDSPYYAAAFVRQMREAARSLRQMARRGRVVPEISDPTIRELLIGNYRLLYQLRKSDVLVIALIHGARDLASLWERDPRSVDED
ncbi:MAG: type II toxin-antitoxin system RelE/ParE family toxin [Thermoanaerobaculia bacterium]